MGSLISLMEMIDGARDQRMLRSIMNSFAHKCGFERFAYLHAAGGQIQTFSNYPPEWEETYIKGHYSVIDPVVTEAGRRTGAFSWTADSWPARGASDTRRFRDGAIDHGLRSGVTIPVTGIFGARLMLTFASSRNDADIAMLPTSQNAIQAIMAIHYQLKMTADAVSNGPIPHLSAREMICLKWAANGKASRDTAMITGINARTVQHYLDNAREKLGAATVPHLVAIAKDLGLI